MDLGVRIAIVSGISDCLSCIPDSKAKGSLFHKQKFPGVRNADSLAQLHVAIQKRASCRPTGHLNSFS